MAELTAKEEKVLGGFKIQNIPPETASDFVQIDGLYRRGSFSFSNARIHSATPEALVELKGYIEARADEIEKEMRGKGAAWLPVRVSKRESNAGRSVQCSIQVFYAYSKGTRAEARQSVPQMDISEHTAAFWAPKSRIHQEGGEFYCPTWLVEKGLEKTRERSKHYSRMDEAHRLPVHPQVWPRGLKQRWVDAHLSQLPCEEEITRVALEKERQWAVACQESDRHWEEVRLEKERREEEAKKEAARRQKLKEKRFESLESRKNVNVAWKEWKKQGGRFVAEEYEAEGVDLYFAGERVYIVFEDGEEIIKKKSSILQINSQEAKIDEV